MPSLKALLVVHYMAQGRRDLAYMTLLLPDWHFWAYEAAVWGGQVMARRPTDRQRLEALLQRHEIEIQAAFLAAFDRARVAVDIAALEAALRSGDISRAADILRMRDDLLAPLGEAIRQAFIGGGVMIGEAIPTSRAVLGFDGRHPRAEAWVQEHAARRIVEIAEDQRRMVRQVVGQQITEGRNPRAIIADIVGRVNRATSRREGGVIGLTSQQAGYVANARRELLDLSAAYFERTRRDRRFDRLVRSAIAEGKALAAADLDRITGRYEARLLAYRGEVIARTESLNALRAGRHEGIAQGVEQGAFRADQVTRVWDATGDQRTRPDHMEMQGQTVGGTDEPFTFPDGSRALYPGDGSLGAPAEQLIQCRCVERIRIDWLR